MVGARMWAERLYEADPDPDNSLTEECHDLSEAQTCALLWAGDANQFVFNSRERKECCVLINSLLHRN
jgi:hypothetical protein